MRCASKLQSTKNWMVNKLRTMIGNGMSRERWDAEEPSFFLEEAKEPKEHFFIPQKSYN